MGWVNITGMVGQHVSEWWVNMLRNLHLSAARLDGSYIKLLNQIAKTPLLIFDDFGLQALTPDMRVTLLQILEDRYANGATIITSQLPVDKWYEYINDPTSADAICDRITANAHKISLKGESLRKRKNN